MGWKEWTACACIAALLLVAGCAAWTDFWTPEGFEEQRPDTIDKAVVYLAQAKEAADAAGDTLPGVPGDVAKTLAIIIAAAGTVLTTVQTIRQRNAAATASATTAATRTMTTWVEEMVIPTLKPEDIKVLEARQKAEGTRETINAVRSGTIPA